MLLPLKSSISLSSQFARSQLTLIINIVPTVLFHFELKPQLYKFQLQFFCRIYRNIGRPGTPAQPAAAANIQNDRKKTTKSSLLHPKILYTIHTRIPYSLSKQQQYRVCPCISQLTPFNIGTVLHTQKTHTIFG